MSNELRHHGVPGMKWGVRKDRGTSTTGTSRSSKAGKSKGLSLFKPKAKPKPKPPEKTKSKSIESMSSDELKKRIERLQLEKRYRELDPNSARTARGREFVISTIEQIGKQTITNLGSQAINHYLGTLINKGAKVDSSDVHNRIVNPQKGQSDKK